MVYDPCFSEAPTDESVICRTSSPWEAIGVRVRLAEPLQLTPQQQHEDFSKVWGLELEDGDRCSWMGGATTTIEGARMNYACGDDWFIFGNWRVEPPWIARKVLLTIPLEHPIVPLESRNVGIVTIWR